MSEVPVYEESFTSAALDGARISVATARLLISLDSTISDNEKLAIIGAITQAQDWLDGARQALHEATEIRVTSVHVVGEKTSGGIIIP